MQATDCTNKTDVNKDENHRCQQMQYSKVYIKCSKEIEQKFFTNINSSKMIPNNT